MHLLTGFGCIYTIISLWLLSSSVSAMEGGHIKHNINEMMALDEKPVDSEKFYTGLQQFARDMYQELVSDQTTKNVVFSPFSIQTCAAMLRMGAAGQTAEELDRGLRLVSNDPNVIGLSYQNILQRYQNSNFLKMANKIYVANDVELQPTFNDLVHKHFYSEVDSISFQDSNKAVDIINHWVEEKTNQRIKKLLQPSMLDSNAKIVLLNAIHFKADWEKPFNAKRTVEKDFYVDETNTVKKQMMRTSDEFLYGEFDELDAQVLLLPYNNTDLSMLVVLPRSRTGLKQLVQKLVKVPLYNLVNNLNYNKVDVELPKFTANFQTELTEPLRKMGIRSIFEHSANLTKMLSNNEPVNVSKVIHKAFIDVNEEGTEAAASSALIGVLTTALFTPPTKAFVADHPFYYSIIDNEGRLEFFRGNLSSDDN